MKQRFRKLDHDLCVRAVLEALDGKWQRGDVKEVVEKYGGVPRWLLERELAAQDMTLRLEAADGIAYAIEQWLLDVMEGCADDLDLDPVEIRPRRDGMTGKMRDIAQLCILHQIYGHLLKLGLEPLFKARLLPQQYASIPSKGQTGLKRKMEKALRSKKLKIRCATKTDVRHAYGTAQYSCVLEILRREIPRARWIIVLTEQMARMAPGGHLIIGGYIDAWFFNFLMSYAMRYVLSLETVRRGKRTPIVKLLCSYMDDFGYLGSRMAGLKSAARKLDVWLRETYGMELKPASSEIRFVSIAEEHALRRVPHRGAPGLDMGGYVVHRTYTSIRRAIFVRVRRQFLRAAWEYERTGTIPVGRCRKLIAYNGYFEHTNTRKVAETLRVAELVKVAKKVIGAHCRMEAVQKERKRLYAYFQRAVQRAAE